MDGSPSPEISRDEVEAALRAALADPEFARNPGPSAFLKLVVAETLAGRGDRLKAFTIATLALKRSADFDPQTNSLVRVQAMRLRDLLENYYAGAGAEDPLQIALPRGAYQPQFHRRRREAPEVPQPAPEAASFIAPAALEATAPQPQAPTPGPRSLWPTPRVIAAAATIAALGAMIGVFIGPPLLKSLAPTPTAPVVVVEPPQYLGDGAARERLAGVMLGSIEQGLAAFEYLSLRRAEEAALAGQVDYGLHSSFIALDGGKFDVALSLVYEPTGGLLWARQLQGVDGANLEAARTLARSVALWVGDVGSGAIFSDLRTRRGLARAPLSGYACEFAAVAYLREREGASSAELRKCLESEVTRRPEDAYALASLSALLIADYLDAAPESNDRLDPSRALELARRAYDLAPQGVDEQAALFAARFYNKHFDDAFLTAEAAMTAVPQPSQLTMRIARAFISRGRYDEGLALLAPIESGPGGAPAAATASLALAALMRDDDRALGRYSMRSNAAGTPLGLTMRIIACRHEGDARGAADARTELRHAFPRFAAEIPAVLERYALTPEIKARLQSELTAAGFAFAASD